MGMSYSIFSGTGNETLPGSPPCTTVIQDKSEEPTVKGEMADIAEATEHVSSYLTAASSSEGKSITTTVCRFSDIVPPDFEFTFRCPISLPEVNQEIFRPKATTVQGPAAAGPAELSKEGVGREVVAELPEMDVLDLASRASLGRREMGSIDAVVVGNVGPEVAGFGSEPTTRKSTHGDQAADELQASILDMGSRSSSAVHRQFAGFEEMIVEAIQGWGGDEEDEDVWYDAEDGSSCEESSENASSETSDDTWSCSFNSSLESLDIADQRFRHAGTVNGEATGGFVLGPDDDETGEVDAGDVSTHEADTEDKVSSPTSSSRSSVGYTSQLPYWATVIPDDPFSPTSDVTEASSSTSNVTTSSKSIIARTKRQYRFLTHLAGDDSTSISVDTSVSTSASTAPSTAPSTSASVGTSTESSTTTSPSRSDPVSPLQSTPIPTTSTTSLTPFAASDTSHAVEKHVAFNPNVTRYSGPPGAVTPVANTSAATPCPTANPCREVKPSPLAQPTLQPVPDTSLPRPTPLSLSPPSSTSAPPPSASTSSPPSHSAAVQILTPSLSSVPALTLTPPTPRIHHTLTPEEKFREKYPGHRYNPVHSRGLLFVNENDRDMNSRQRKKARVENRWVVVKRRRDRFQEALRPVVGPGEAIRRAFDAARGWEGWCWE